MSRTERTVQLLLDEVLPSDVTDSETTIILAIFAKEPEEGLTASSTIVLEIVQEEYVGE